MQVVWSDLQRLEKCWREADTIISGHDKSVLFFQRPCGAVSPCHADGAVRGNCRETTFMRKCSQRPVHAVRQWVVVETHALQQCVYGTEQFMPGFPFTFPPCAHQITVNSEAKAEWKTIGFFHQLSAETGPHKA